MKKIKFRLAAYTDAAGKRNDNPPLYGNEDNFFVDADLSNEQQGNFSSDEERDLSDYGSLLVIADGMGGMNAGEVASEIAVRTVRECFAHEKLTKEIVAEAKSRERYMEHVVEEADAAIKAHARENKECEGMGSTLIMVWVCDGAASVTWCGDSRAYLFHEPKGIVQISKDHSYVQSLVDDGKITDEEAFDHPYGNIITQSLGDPEKKAKADSRTISLYKGDIILVCSDGLSGVLRDRPLSDGTPAANLEEIIRSNRSSMQACRETLFAAAEQADWYDNVTAILYEITDGEDTPEQECNNNVTAVSKSFISIKINKKRLLYWIIALIVIAVLACGGFFGMKFLKEKEPATEKTEQSVDGNPEQTADETDPAASGTETSEQQPKSENMAQESHDTGGTPAPEPPADTDKTSRETVSPPVTVFGSPSEQDSLTTTKDSLKTAVDSLTVANDPLLNTENGLTETTDPKNDSSESEETLTQE